MILPAQTILRLDLIRPCEPRTILHGVSYGLGPAGYDLRVKEELHLWQGHSVLTDAIEQFNMPADIQGKLFTKSTWARLHVRVANTVIDPGFHGVLRLELSQHGGPPVTIPSGVGIAFVEFTRLEEPTDRPYSGKYQNQGSKQDAIFEGENGK